MPHFIFIQQITVLNILNMLYNLHFFSLKCRLFHNATLFGFCITHILNTGCAKIWKKSVAKRLRFCDSWYTFMGLRCKTSTQARPAISFSFTNAFGMLFFSEYVNTYIVSILEFMGYPVWACLIILLDNFFSCCGESTVFLPSLDLLCLFTFSGLYNGWQQR